jgi:4-hydroxybenzoate polyprenyltransferase
VIARLGRYVAGSFPPTFYLPYAAAWALGGTAMFALARHAAPTWRPGWSTLATLATFTVLLLLIRAIDDLRDLEYDREHNPRRPLASGAVTVSDLGVLVVAGAVTVLLLNAPRGAVWAAAAVALAYATALLVADRLLHWPSGDAIIVSALMSLPVQLLLGAYLYAAFVRDTHSPAGLGALLPLATMAAIFAHLELARKTARVPRPGERTYVSVLGVRATAMSALAAAAIATLLALLLTRPWAPGGSWGWLVLAPALLPVRGALRFQRGNAARWPVADSGFYILAAFTAFLVVDLLERRTP